MTTEGLTSARFAPYSEGEANDGLSYIHPLLRHLAVPIGSVLLEAVVDRPGVGRIAWGSESEGA